VPWRKANGFECFRGVWLLYGSTKRQNQRSKDCGKTKTFDHPDIDARSTPVHVAVRSGTGPVSVQSFPTFIKTNYILTAVWALAMAILALADLTMHFFQS
jgi:hypothetical protein